MSGRRGRGRGGGAVGGAALNAATDDNWRTPAAEGGAAGGSGGGGTVQGQAQMRAGARRSARRRNNQQVQLEPMNGNATGSPQANSSPEPDQVQLPIPVVNGYEYDNSGFLQKEIAAIRNNLNARNLSLVDRLRLIDRRLERMVSNYRTHRQFYKIKFSDIEKDLIMQLLDMLKSLMAIGHWRLSENSAIPGFVLEDFTEEDPIYQHAESIILASCDIYRIFLSEDDVHGEYLPLEFFKVLFSKVYETEITVPDLLDVYDGSWEVEVFGPYPPSSVAEQALVLMSVYVVRDYFPKIVDVTTSPRVVRDQVLALLRSHLVMSWIIIQRHVRDNVPNDITNGREREVSETEKILLFTSALLSAVIAVYPSEAVTTEDKTFVDKFAEFLMRLMKQDFEIGSIPVVTVPLVIRMLEREFGNLENMKFFFTPVKSKELTNYLDGLKKFTGMKMRRPMQINLNVRDDMVNPWIGMAYCLIVFIEKLADERGFSPSYLRTCDSQFLTVGLEAATMAIQRFPEQMVGNLAVLMDMTTKLMVRLRSPRYRDEWLHMVDVNRSRTGRAMELHMFKSVFLQSFQATIAAFESLEKVLQEGKDVPKDLNVTRVVKKWLELPDILDGIGLEVFHLSALAFISEVGPGIMRCLPNDVTVSVIKRIITYRNSRTRYSAEIAAKSVRAIGKIAACPELFSGPNLIPIILDRALCLTNSDGVNVKTNWSWAVAEFTQSLKCASERFQTTLKDDQLIRLLGYVHTICQGPVKGRYSGYRAAGLLFTMLDVQADANSKREILEKASAIVMLLRAAIGSPEELRMSKNRWNAAFGMGCIFDNEDFVQFLKSKTDPRRPNNLLYDVVGTLGEWARRAQNSKLRMQCLQSLRKITSYDWFGPMYDTVLNDIIQAGLSRDFSEDLETVSKCSTECAQTLGFILSLIRPENVPVFYSILDQKGEIICEEFILLSHELGVDNKGDFVYRGRDRLMAIARDDNCAPIIRQQAMAGVYLLNILLKLGDEFLTILPELRERMRGGTPSTTTAAQNPEPAVNNDNADTDNTAENGNVDEEAQQFGLLAI